MDKKIKTDIPNDPFNPLKDSEDPIDDDNYSEPNDEINSHYNYLIKVGILNDPNIVPKLNTPKNIRKAEEIIFTKEFRDLPIERQESLISKHTKDWYEIHGDEFINDLYTEKLNDGTIKAPILHNWNQWVKDNMRAIFQKLLW